MASGVNYLSDEESRWVVIGICLTKVLTPTLRTVVDAELQSWHNLLKNPPVAIDKQVPGKHKKTLPPSTFPLQYKNINGNNMHKSSSAYDYAVKDPLSLARLFVQPFMAKFTGFDDTMDLSALLSIMCEADPFVKSGAAAHARTVRSKVRNEWAHTNFSKWTITMFNDAIRDMQCLVTNINLSADVEKEVCDNLEDWKNKVSDVFIDGRYSKLIGESLCELRRCIETWHFEGDTKMNELAEKLDLIQSKLLCRIDENSEKLKRNKEQIDRNTDQTDRNTDQIDRNTDQIDRNTDQIDRNRSEIERLHKRPRTEPDNEQKENYSQFAEKKIPYGLRSLPRDLVKRPSEVNEILRLLTQGKSSVGVVGSRGGLSGDVFGIRGMGGLGKTVLALAVAWEVSVSRQVVWLDIGETPDCLALINILIKVLGGDVSFSEIRAAQGWIKANTSDKDCLVVLDDVWSVNDVAVFDHLSEKCQLLITTRDVNVVRGSRGVVYELDIMKQDESRALFYRSAGIKPDELSGISPKMLQIIEELLKLCRGLPLALSLVGSNLNGTRSEQDWKDILDGFTTDLEEIRSMFPDDDYPYDNMIKAINVSFVHLEKCEQEKFLDFAIFPEDTNIPSDILELFWSSEGAGRTSCNRRKARRILDALERKSMIQKGTREGGFLVKNWLYLLFCSGGSKDKLVHEKF